MKNERINKAIEIAVQYGGIGGDHHKAWVIDQMVRALTGCPIVEQHAISYSGEKFTFQGMGESQEYINLVREAKNGEDGPETYGWDIGIAP